MAGKALRDVFGDTLVELGRENDMVVVLDADVSNSTKTVKFGKEFPDRFFNVGIAEANMVSIAAGMASAGLIPYVSTFSFLLALRAADQVRTQIAYPRLGVKLAAGYGGLSDSFDGATHHAICDVAVARSLPNMTVVVPADPAQTRALTKAVASLDGPVFLRLSRAEAEDVFSTDDKFEVGKGIVVEDGSEGTIVVMGTMLMRVLEARRRLEREGIRPRIVNIHTLKPIDRELIVKCARETGFLVTVEEHNIYGGLGSAVSEVLVREAPVPQEFVGIPDKFAESGPYGPLLDKYGLGVEDIVTAAKRGLARAR